MYSIYDAHSYINFNFSSILIVIQNLKMQEKAKNLINLFRLKGKENQFSKN